MCLVRFVQPIGAEILVAAVVVGEQGMCDFENRMRHSEARLFGAASTRQLMVFARKVVVLGAGRRPTRLSQARLQPAVAVAHSARLPFAGALVMAGTNARPRRQVRRRG